MDPFELNVDIDFEDVGDDDDDDYVKPRKNKKIEATMNKRKDTDDDRVQAKTKAKSNDNDVESFDDDPKQFEKQEDNPPLVVLPLQGGLAGLINNLSGVKYFRIKYFRHSLTKNVKNYRLGSNGFRCWYCHW